MTLPKRVVIHGLRNTALSLPTHTHTHTHPVLSCNITLPLEPFLFTCFLCLWGGPVRQRPLSIWLCAVALIWSRWSIITY